MDRKSAFRDYFLDLFKPNFSAIIDFQRASRYEAAIKYCEDYGVSNIQVLVIEWTVYKDIFRVKFGSHYS